MKTPPLTALAAATLALGGSPVADAEPSKAVPTGWLEVDRDVLRTGTYPTLTWAIHYPSNLESVLNRDANGSLCPGKPLEMHVAIVGASNQVGVADGNPTYAPVEFEVRVGGGSSYTPVFQNLQTAVDPSEVLLDVPVPASTQIDLRARAGTGTAWLPYQSTESATPNVLVLTAGQVPPLTVTNDLRTFLAPYLDANGAVKIGPMDMLYLFELGESDPLAAGFNLQDLVVLVSFDSTKNNNGHGNNLDGVDCSNPGEGDGGPNGTVDVSLTDPSGVVDDEGKPHKP